MTPPIALSAALDAATSGLGLEQQEPPAPELPIAERRRSRRAPVSRLTSLSLTNVDGVLRFEPGAPARRSAVRRRRRGATAGLGGEVVREFRFEELPPSEIGRYLGALDRKLNPNSGLRRLVWTTTGAALVPLDGSLINGRTLLFIHGTFSKSEAFLEALGATDHGRALLKAITTTVDKGGVYAQVLAFDHPTVGVSPVMNAFDLALATQDITAPIDVVSHSRGGLVARWWRTGFRPEPDGARTVFVGAPLAGTSLAAPPRLKEAMEMIANVANVFRGVTTLASVAVPFLSVATGLMKVVASVTSLTARTPLLDAVMAMIPGLSAQGRVGSNPELGRLQLLSGAAPAGWYAVQANFEPEPTGWKFWKRFVRIGTDLADLGSDAVFRDQNDLVVDTTSMTALADTMRIPAARLLDFGTTGVVHHCNYFEQPETVRFLRDVFRLP